MLGSLAIAMYLLGLTSNEQLVTIGLLFSFSNLGPYLVAMLMLPLQVEEQTVVR